jgi:hypothetical protein
MAEEERDQLMTDDDARDELGYSDEALRQTIADGEVRRVQFGGGAFVLRDDVQRIRDSSDPSKLAQKVPRL